MSVIDRYTDYLLPSYSNLPRGKYISLFVVRRIESEAIFRTEGSGEPLNKEFVHAGSGPNSDIIPRVVISKRKQTAVERRTGRELLRSFNLLFANKDGGICSLNANNPCERCLDCMVYGYAAGGGGAQRSRVITDDAFSLHQASMIVDTRTFNAPFDNSTPSLPEKLDTKPKRMTGLGADEYVRPEAVFLDIETLHDVTPGELRYILGNLLRSSRYGAISSRIGKVRNTLAGVALSDCELFSNLELTQHVYDLLRGGQAELDFPLKSTNVEQPVRDAIQVLRRRVVGRVTLLDGDTLGELLSEISELYANEEHLRESVRETTRSYGRGLPE